jgi:hypothetical protein
MLQKKKGTERAEKRVSAQRVPRKSHRGFPIRSRPPPLKNKIEAPVPNGDGFAKTHLFRSSLGHLI